MTTTDEQAAEAHEYVPIQARGWGVPIALAIVAILALMAIGVSITKLVTDTPKAKTLTYVVPAGTAEQLFFGETVEIMPAEVRLNVGDTLVVRNEDTQTMTVGPFTVRGGETLSQEFKRPQTLIGECSLSGSGEIKIIVT